MSIFRFVNVGQGDCCILRTPSYCKYSNEVFYVDLGDGACDITKYIGKNDKVNIVLTHHHDDHIGGLKCFKGVTQIKRIILPCCQNEIILIANAILNLKGIAGANNCQDLIDEFKRMVKIHLDLKNNFNNDKNIFGFIYYGEYLCEHIQCLNPPEPLRKNDKYNYFHGMIEDIFNKEFADNLKEYFNSETYNYYNKNGKINSDMENVLKFQDIYIPNDLPYQKTIVKSFILDSVKNFYEFNKNKNRTDLKKIYDKFKHYTHDFCIVLKAKYEDKTMLLTGDVSKKVFNDLIRAGDDITSDYLKVPHHGSKENIDQNIINVIHPKNVIISHGNGKFGKSKDSHPNTEVLDLLKKNQIKVLLTNDVVKNGKVVKKKQGKYNDGFVEI